MSSFLIVSTPWYGILACLLPGAVFAFWLYRRHGLSQLNNRLRWALAALRFFSVSLICLLLAAIFLRHTEYETEDPVVLLAVDNSSSMAAGKDSIFVKHQLPAALKKLSEKVSSKYRLRTVLFDAGVRPGSQPDFTGRETDLAHAIEALSTNYANMNVGALVVVTDGIVNKGSDPSEAASRLSFPVYFVATGDTAEVRDLLIRDVRHNQVAYAGNDFPAQVVVAARRCNGQKAIVTIQHGGELQRKEILIDSDNFLAPVDFTLSAGSPGILRYSARVTVLPHENPANNAQSFVVEVIDSKQKILLLTEAPHPDAAAIGDALAQGAATKMEQSSAAAFHGPLKPYSLVIIHTPAANGQRIMNECLSTGIPVLVINPPPGVPVPGVRISNSGTRYVDAEPVLESSFGLFTASDALRQFIGELPAVKSPFGLYSVSQGAQSLITQRIGSVETSNPLLVFTESGGVKCAAFLGDGLWRWRLRDQAMHRDQKLFAELIGKTVQYLSVKEDKSFFRVTMPRIANEAEPVVAEAELYNRSYEPVTDPDVTITLTDSLRHRFSYTFSKSDKGYRLSVNGLAPGEYNYKAVANYNGQHYEKHGLLAIREVVAERLNTVADHRLLARLAYGTGGAVIPATRAVALADTLLASDRIRPVTYSSHAVNPLIGLKWLFFVLLVALSAEWFLRRRYLAI